MPFGDEHEAFRRSVRAFVEREIAPGVLEWEAAGAVPRALFRRAGELGLLGIRLSPELGGSGQDFWYTAVLVEELVRCGSVGVAVSLLAHAEFATHVLDRHGSDEIRQSFVRPAIGGARIGALGLTEPGVGSDLGALTTRAERRGDDFVIDGAKTFITNGTLADFVTTAVRTGGAGPRGISLVVVPTDAPGFVRGKRLEKLGAHASDTAEIAFESCRVPARFLVGVENEGFRMILEGFAGERLVLSLIGCAQLRLLWQEARRHGLERKAFGQPLLGFQVWRHRLADAAARIEAAEALTHRAIDRWVRGEPSNAEISMAKLVMAETVRDVAHECLQIHGGMGCMEATLAARLYRDSIGFGVGAGTSEIMREIIAKERGLVP